MIGWHVCVGIEKIWNSEPDVGLELHELAAFVAARRADLGDHAGAANRRHAVADRAARAVERRTETLLRRFDLREIVEAKPEFLEFAAGDPRQRISRKRTDGLSRDLDAEHRDVHTDCQRHQALHVWHFYSSTMI